VNWSIVLKISGVVCRLVVDNLSPVPSHAKNVVINTRVAQLREKNLVDRAGERETDVACLKDGVKRRQMLIKPIHYRTIDENCYCGSRTCHCSAFPVLVHDSKFLLFGLSYPCQTSLPSVSTTRRFIV
jgi:hypothetical protein